VNGPVVVLPGLPTTIDPTPVIDQMLRRASSSSFEAWWRRAESVGFCAHPIQLVGTDHIGRQQVVWTRCNNRRGAVCPSCSDLYARDTWQLVHAGAAGGHHNVPTEVAARPQVFATLTAPGYGAVHNATGTHCHPTSKGPGSGCIHGNPLRCNTTHSVGDPVVGQPLCGRCYDYIGHVLFTWHLPELWRRFTITLRRTVAGQLTARGMASDSVRVSFVKVVELQTRAIPHIHSLIRLYPPSVPTTRSDQNHHGPAATGGGGESRSGAGDRGWVSPITAGELAALIQRAARQTSLEVPAGGGEVRQLRFGSQIDTQAVVCETMTEPADPAPTMTPGGLSPRRVAAYLAKYVTKSLHDFGITARRLSAEAIGELDTTDHVRAILTTIADLAERATGGGSMAGIGRWLHTLGYRGHITTKSRCYSTTMGALRAARATWTRNRNAKYTERQGDTRPIGRNGPMAEAPVTPDDGDVLWEFDHAGHTSAGDRTLVYSAALQRIHTRRIGLVEARRQARDQQGDPPGGNDD
jgi:hypothetical protein